MDAAYYEDLAERLYGLVIRLNDRLPADQVQWLYHVTEVGEYRLALEDMAAMLTDAQVAITDEEYNDMVALVRQMGMDKRVSDALRSCLHAALNRPVQRLPWLRTRWSLTVGHEFPTAFEARHIPGRAHSGHITSRSAEKR